ncbi:hypothetical protein CINS5915_06380 [Campylobacter insulaenigrae]|uniref:hypothetical protein n=1 Tax=Campylobacter insulaenigrae TaxID=260714 RepID=UPI000F6BFCAA|nr:hypothetical protein [Campylobacter insulaenigrae]MCR6571277.1 hypothetical protein [Campylobacter insulaenigrae]MCR6573059.1 hypothetical protein [Campylobacter insulaenigrae]MCR6575986.1 hypothetical protein [Campylobacter insulaenigrae]MCR6577542.1 hypothetical protein [Campylobacter insulaenigrae]MCR6579077.1 hypothetical protein [Campylobacter insulaenigrae]
MSTSFLIILIFILILAIVLGIVAIIFFNRNDKNTKQQNLKPNISTSNIEDFISKANSAKNSQAIHELILQFLNSQKLNTNSKDKSTKRKLDFVSAISANSNATPKNISFLNNELKKRYMSLKKEIDAYEQIGLAKRKMREA